jgi:hypothetical protein
MTDTADHSKIGWPTSPAPSFYPRVVDQARASDHRRDW